MVRAPGRKHSSAPDVAGNDKHPMGQPATRFCSAPSLHLVVHLDALPLPCLPPQFLPALPHPLPDPIFLHLLTPTKTSSSRVDSPH
ncbi:hypothetical protein TYRP_012871 [Tyrophagus putrescentiae]|nr:hypothetical protein TYRP_012871 [Tyrophagus putrescentiae]